MRDDDGAAPAAEGESVDFAAVARLLPQRYPQRLIDRILVCEAGRRLVARKGVTSGEPFFAGHFPGWPVMPGVLMCEGAAQVCTILMKKRAGWGLDKFIGLGGLDNVRFRGQVSPPCRVHFVGMVGQQSSRIAKYPAQCFVDGKLMMDMELLGVLL